MNIKNVDFTDRFYGESEVTSTLVELLGDIVQKYKSSFYSSNNFNLKNNQGTVIVFFNGHSKVGIYTIEWGKNCWVGQTKKELIEDAKEIKNIYNRNILNITYFNQS